MFRCLLFPYYRYKYNKYSHYRGQGKYLYSDYYRFMYVFLAHGYSWRYSRKKTFEYLRDLYK